MPNPRRERSRLQQVDDWLNAELYALITDGLVLLEPAVPYETWIKNAKYGMPEKGVDTWHPSVPKKLEFLFNLAFQKSGGLA